MKMIARGYVWWTGLDHEIEETVKNCTSCQENRQDPKKEKLHVWEEASKPFQRVHIDYAGPISGKYLLVVVDAFSKWPEVKVVNDMTAQTTIRELRYIFAAHGFPEILVSDRGTQFTSAEFFRFCNLNGVKHKMGAPFHPSTNYPPQNLPQIKDKLLALKDWEKKDLERKICSILMEYRRAPHATTGVSPSQKLYNRQIRSRLDLIFPQEDKSEQNVKKLSVQRDFQVGDRVAARNYLQKGVKWKFGKITKKMGKLHYYIQLDDDRMSSSN